MSVLIDDILSGLLADGMIFAIKEAWAADRRKQGLSPSRKELLSDHLLRSAIDDAVDEILDVAELSPTLGGSRTKSFLASSECKDIVVGAFVIEIGEDRDSLSELREMFRLSIKYWSDAEDDVVDEDVDLLFSALCKAVNTCLAGAIEGDLIEASDARDNYRHQLLSQRLAAIELGIAALRAGEVPAQSALEDFEQTFRAQVIDREAMVLPPSFQANERRHIDKVFVEPKFQGHDLKANSDQEELGYERVSSAFHRVVVLGDPGGGKSTLTQKLAVDLSSDKIALGEKQNVFRVVLRELSSANKKSPVSVSEFVSRLPVSRYQMPEPHRGLVEHLFRCGRAVVIFDGLDELMDIAERRRVIAEIESFCNLYPSVPVLVTSRRIGYEQAAMRADMFDICDLAKFDVPQIEDYVTKWFSLEAIRGTTSVADIVVEFMDQSSEVEDLRSNPLLLGLMCNLYRGENAIPSNRPEVYEKCSLMLFERWDKQRGIHEPIKFASKLRPSMQHLAQWIFFSSELSAGVSETALIDETARFLETHRFRDPDDAHDAAAQFVGICKGRAWVFTNTNTSRRGEELFTFTHRTFLEYFTAEWVVGAHQTHAELAEYVWRHAIARDSSVVMQLALQIAERRNQEVSDVVLQDLLSRAEECESETRVAIYAFCVDCLRYLVPAPDTTRAIVDAALSFVADELATSWEAFEEVGRPSEYESNEFEDWCARLDEIVRLLFECGPEQQKEVSDSASVWVSGTIDDTCSGEVASRSAFAANLALSQVSLGNVDEDQIWNQPMLGVVAEKAKAFAEVGSVDLGVAIELVTRDRMPISDFINAWGFAGMFHSPLRISNPSSRHRSVAATAVARLLAAHSPDPEQLWAAKCLGYLGRWVGENPDRAKLEDSPNVFDFGWPFRCRSPYVLHHDVVLGAFVVACVERESRGSENRTDTGFAAIDVARAIAGSPAGKPIPDDVATKLFSTKENCQFVQSWLLGEIKIIERSGGELAASALDA